VARAPTVQPPPSVAAPAPSSGGRAVGAKAPTVASNFREISVPVNGDDKACARLADMGYVPKKLTGPYSPHPLSAAIRYYANAYALYRAYSDGHRNVVSVYGGLREQKIAQYLNKRVIRDPLVLEVHRPTLAPQDLARTVPDSLDNLDLSQHDAVLMNDIYACEAGALTPHMISIYCEHGPLYWVGHTFNGAAGTLHGEGGWARVDTPEGPRILSRPDKDTPAYVPHPCLDWLSPSGVDGPLAWTLLQSFGDTHVYKFQLAQIEFTAGQPRNPPRFEVREIPAPADSWTTRSLLWAFGWNPATKWWCKTQNLTGIVDNELVAELKLYLQGRTHNVYSFRQMFLKASQPKGQLKLLADLFPQQLGSVVENSCLLAFYGESARKAAQAYNFRQVQARTLNVYTTSVQNLNIPLASTPKKFAQVGLGVVAVLFFLFRFSPRFRGWVRYWTVKFLGGPPLAANFLGACPPVLSQYTHYAKDYARFAGFWSIFHTLLAPFTEEAIKRIHPVVGRAFYLIEYALYCYGEYPISGNMVFLRRLWPVMMHEVALHMRYPSAVALHLLWNATAHGVGIHLLGRQISAAMVRYPPGTPYQLSAQSGIVASTGARSAMTALVGVALWAGDRFVRRVQIPRRAIAFERFKEEYHVMPWATRQVVQTRVGSSGYPPSSAFVPDAMVSHFVPEARDEGMRYTRNFAPEQEPRGNSVLWFLPTSQPMYKPARTDANLLAVLEARLLVEPPMKPADQHAAWKAVKTVVSLEPPFGEAYEELQLEWLERFTGPKRLRAEAALELLRDGPGCLSGATVKSQKVMVKTNEVLCKIDDQHQMFLKPRAIVNVSPLLQAATGPHILGATKRLKKQWSWKFKARQHERPVAAGPWSVYITYGGAATDLKLTRWMSRVLLMSPHEAAVLVAGDDSLVAVCHGDGSIEFFEGDFRMYDQSQSRGPLKKGLRDYKRLGIPSEVTKLIKSTYTAKYVFHSRYSGKGSIVHEDRWLRATGGGDTSLGNTDTTATSWCFALEDIEHVAERFLALGLSIKLRRSFDPLNVTFLKGKWYPTGSGLVWGFLPSRILKIGKSLRDPRVLYKTKDLQQATACFASDLAHSFVGFLQIPLIRAFVRRYRIHPLRINLLQELDVQVATTGAFSQCIVSDWSSLVVRYDASWEDFEEIEEMIDQSSIFTFLEHPLFVELARIDYN